ncbi:Clr6 histone deacetylase complex subunit Pst1 [Schizosaccharomyces osmophilus]|uniref:Clr6 histone deacetylase complex subunit Pst1 n=1 Tax=Schizosaccharomyces osmophilus TaxID=2545709 RepID=A0AAE9WDT3_9SCHI|nr:Clr6 histone deacetylase complex subunit Pst1 [Schizosaccharomyces osmophilus]WBW73779.1 Clr6 histone deacetylase complex subunit Pst1 [Schizosaccharomyces osmophilus]
MAKDWQDAHLGQCQRIEDYPNVAINYPGSYVTPSGTMAYHPTNTPFYAQVPTHTSPQGTLYPVYNSVSPVYDPTTGRVLYRNIGPSPTASIPPARHGLAVYGPSPHLQAHPAPSTHPGEAAPSTAAAGSQVKTNGDYPSQAMMAPSGESNNVSRPTNARSSVSPFVTNQKIPLASGPSSQPPPANNEFRQLNVTDALSYLDLVKLQFHHEPEVYNEFLDIMKEFKSQAIETPEVITRVSALFSGYPALIQGFNTFLPPGYGIELGPSEFGKPPAVHITTPQGPLVIADWNRPHATAQVPSGYQKPAPYQPANSQPAVPSPGVIPPSAQSSTFAPYKSSPSPMPPSFPSVDASVKQAADLDHAIHFVNNVKNRFSHKPEAYNAFLDILKSYQHDQRPIQLVYYQVSQLFAEAPDLLEEFKRFLPDVSLKATSENQEKPAAAISEPAAQASKASPATTTSSLPPIGKFAPPAPVKPPQQTEKRRVEPAVYTRSHAKRTRTATQAAEEYSPRAFNVPIAQNKNPTELAFLDAVRQYLVNESKYNEFIKLLELYSQEVFDKNALVERCQTFLHESEHLMNWLKDLVKWDSNDCIPVPRPRVDLTQCKGYGPSYRLLPKIELLLPCSGRDDVCWTILNDAWVSHPTLASEDSGFIAHRKNQFEESLHRLEEERYKYDRHIGANVRAIELLEMNFRKMQKLTENEKESWTLPVGLGGKSPSIYQKVIRKVYGKEAAQEIIENLQKHPAITIPIVLNRLKQTDREWRGLQKHWNELWHDIEERNFYRSLDHQGITFKSTDKKNTTPKFLIGELRNLSKQQKNETEEGKTAPSYQYLFEYKDKSIVLDMARLFGVFLVHVSTHSIEDREKLSIFLRSFLSIFFDIPYESFEQFLPSHFNDDDSETESQVSSLDKTRRSNTPTSHGVNNGLGLLKDIFKKSQKGPRESRSVKSESAPESTEETPEPNEVDEYSVDAEEPNDLTATSIFSSGEVWVNCRFTDSDGALLDDGTKLSDRNVFNLFGNMGLYCFFRLFHILYTRLEHLKGLEEKAYQKQHGIKPNPVALELGLIRDPSERLGFTLPHSDTVYGQALGLCERIIEGEIDQNGFEDALRCLYGIHGFRMYTVEKIIGSLMKQLHTITSNRRIAQVFMFFERDRVQRKTSPRQQIMYRVQTETVLGPDEDLCCIDWNSETQQSAIRLMGREDLTMANPKTDAEKWCYYIGSYIMSSPTEGILPEQVRVPFLHRNLPIDDVNEEDENNYVVRNAHAILTNFLRSGLALTIPINTVKIVYEPNTEDVFARNSKLVYTGSYTKIKSYRLSRWREWLESEDGWSRGLTKEKSKKIKSTSLDTLFAETNSRAWKQEQMTLSEGKGKNGLNTATGNGKKSGYRARGAKSNVNAEPQREKPEVDLNDDNTSEETSQIDGEDDANTQDEDEAELSKGHQRGKKYDEDNNEIADKMYTKEKSPKENVEDEQKNQETYKQSANTSATNLNKLDADMEDDKTDMEEQADESFDGDNTMEDDLLKE